jgi:hypothetical protein
MIHYCTAHSWWADTLATHQQCTVQQAISITPTCCLSVATLDNWRLPYRWQNMEKNEVGLPLRNSEGIAGRVDRNIHLCRCQVTGGAPRGAAGQRRGAPHLHLTADGPYRMWLVAHMRARSRACSPLPRSRGMHESGFARQPGWVGADTWNEVTLLLRFFCHNS